MIFFLTKDPNLKKDNVFFWGGGVEVAGEGSLGGRGLEFFLGGGEEGGCGRLE